MFNAALYWHSKNISTVPCYHRTKKPMIKWLWLKEQLPTIEQISKWFSQKCNIALITTDKLIVLDFDCPQQYAEWFCWQSEQNPQVLDTHIILTSRGMHLYYWLEQPLAEPIKSELYEIKSHGRLITVPPSIHPSGTPYRALNSPDNILTVPDISSLLTFSPIELKQTVIKNNDPWQINEPTANGRVDLLELFPEAKQTDSKGQYWITDCPFHGHRENFMLNVKDGVCYCYSGCGTFLATKLAEVMEGRDVS